LRTTPDDVEAVDTVPLVCETKDVVGATQVAVVPLLVKTVPFAPRASLAIVDVPEPITRSPRTIFGSNPVTPAISPDSILAIRS
jgi:hypothetical protein